MSFQSCTFVNNGVVNDQFSQVQTLKSVNGPDFVVQLVDTYFAEMETLLAELSSHSDLPALDFSKLAVLAGKVKDLSSCMGAEHVRLSCANLIQACDQKNKQNFSQALIWMKNEFSQTRIKLEAYAQMERRIIRVQRRQQK
ncbi:histidine-containing phosphotransfer protein 1 [Morus notabilis]|uniref:histidine-containing phosphotransfer protein 1 n=1 Tax=Morus notabilis TaxID=981085 RepID=UPI000CED7054|nr:histidine-containing phosphotransfer protein 1 [Morus notabilis]XP_024019268.1 histidine-containing phosphotransfer protein 1 [Morus notabilis]XP_024019269.1 histidine-containing phosphotransfer protein 1 [Morus notabilis]XP_024019270.1 histidine-containing phosphotransfer protein 1 [Morus notabilis]